MTADWKQVRLGELTEAASPITYGVVKPGGPGEVLFIRGGDLAGGGVRVSQLRTITREVSKQYSRTLLRGGELLICLVGQPGQVAVAPPALAGANIARQVGLIRLRRQVDAEFVSYFLQSPDGQASIGTHTGGSVQQVINLGDLKTVNVPVPPLPEQHRIVRILDEAFEGIATAKANAKKNLQNALALFESHLQGVFTQRGEGWVEKPLAELCDATRVITYGVIKLGDEAPDGVVCLRTSNVRWLRIETEGMKRIAPELSSEYSRTILKGGEVLVNVRGTLGGVAVATSKMVGWNVSREVAVVPVDPKRINPAFLSYLIGSGVSQQWLGSVQKGAAYVGINIEDLRLLPVAAPKLDKQIEVVRHLESLQKESRHLESLYRKKLTSFDALKKSLLHQAFTGNL